MSQPQNHITKGYPGAKQGAGVIPFMANNTPFHHRYFELFAGSASYYHSKRPAAISFLNDLNSAVVRTLQHFEKNENYGLTGTYVSWGDAVDYLLKNKTDFTRFDFINLDPPYPADDRRSAAIIYKCEMLEDTQHMRLLKALKGIDANIMLHTGTNTLYHDYLIGCDGEPSPYTEPGQWRYKDFHTMGHREPRIERIYMNYPEPRYLHEYTWLGDDYITRQNKKRKRQRLERELKTIDEYDRHMMIEEIIKNHPAEVQHFMAVLQAKK